MKFFKATKLFGKKSSFHKRTNKRKNLKAMVGRGKIKLTPFAKLTKEISHKANVQKAGLALIQKPNGKLIITK